MPWGTKVGKTEEVEVQDDVDDLFKSDDEFQKIFAVPRLLTCISTVYLR
jgi:hypothetical protein